MGAGDFLRAGSKLCAWVPFSDKINHLKEVCGSTDLKPTISKSCPSFLSKTRANLTSTLAVSLKLLFTITQLNPTGEAQASSSLPTSNVEPASHTHAVFLHLAFRILCTLGPYSLLPHGPLCRGLAGGWGGGGAQAQSLSPFVL